MIYAVFDTNVLVSALITHNVNASTVKVVEAIGNGKVIPLYNDEIVAEYDEVLSREKFGLLKSKVKRLIETLKNKGIDSERVASGEAFPDVSDAVFYEVALSKENAYLVTGNLKHFPSTPMTDEERIYNLENDYHVPYSDRVAFLMGWLGHGKKEAWMRKYKSEKK